MQDDQGGHIGIAEGGDAPTRVDALTTDDQEITDPLQEMRAEVAGYDMRGDRRFTIGVGQATPYRAVDTKHRGIVVEGPRARRVWAREERERDNTTWLDDVPEGEGRKTLLLYGQGNPPLDRRGTDQYVRSATAHPRKARLTT